MNHEPHRLHPNTKEGLIEATAELKKENEQIVSELKSRLNAAS